MMFLFAVPAMEALGVLLLPQMLAARDLPFPRLSAYAFWAYLVGGLCFFGSLFFGLAPNGGWFMYPPLTSMTYSPGINADFRSEEHTSELQSLMRISYAVFCLKKKKKQ